jgi:VanZ family protein
LSLGWLLVAVTVVFSLLPAPPSGPVVIDDKILHAATYFLLASWFAGIYRPSRYGVIGGGLLLLGAVIELMQRAGGERMGEWLDLAANAAGIAVGLALARLGLGAWCAWFERLVPGARHA